jgi:pyruvate,water dikinase
MVEELMREKGHLNGITRALLRWAIRRTQAGVRRRELSKSLQVKCHSLFKRMYRQLGARMVEEGFLPADDSDLAYFLTHAEIGTLVGVQSKFRGLGAAGSGTGNSGSIVQSQLLKRALQRRQLLPAAEAMHFIDLAQGKPQPLPEESKEKKVRLSSDPAMVLEGTPVSVGVATARVRVVRTLDAARDLQVITRWMCKQCVLITLLCSFTLQLGEILVCPLTDVGWTPYFALASASIVTCSLSMPTLPYGSLSFLC